MTVLGTMASPLGALERAVDEVEALEAIFGFDEGGFVVHSAPELAAARSMVEAGGDGDWTPPQLELEVRVDVEGEEGPQAVRLRCTLPGGYPESSCAAVSVAMAGVRRSTQDQLTAALGQKALELLGEEAVMELVQELQEIAPAALADERAAIAAAAAPAAVPAAASESGLDGFGRRWMWAHHIASTARRGLICKEARSLSLGGYLKPGCESTPPLFVPATTERELPQSSLRTLGLTN